MLRRESKLERLSKLNLSSPFSPPALKDVLGERDALLRLEGLSGKDSTRGRDPTDAGWEDEVIGGLGFESKGGGIDGVLVEGDDDVEDCESEANAKGRLTASIVALGVVMIASTFSLKEASRESASK